MCKAFNILLIYFTLLATNCIAQFSFVHITDIHVADGLSAGNYDLNGEKFNHLLDEFRNLNPKPAFVIATGDISHAGNYGSDGMFPALTQYLYYGNDTTLVQGNVFIDSALTIPIFFTPGNHDFRTTNVPPYSNTDLHHYESYLVASNDMAVICSNAIILLINSGYDDLRSLWDDSNYMVPEGSGLTNEQINSIRNKLAEYPDKKKIIAMHHPPVNVAGTYPEGSPYTGTIVDNADGSIKYNRETLLNICDSNNVTMILAGHMHQNVVATRNGIVVDENSSADTRYVQTASTMDGCYRIITVYPDTVSTIYPNNVYLSPPILINPTGGGLSETNLYKKHTCIYYSALQSQLIIRFENGTVYDKGIVEIYSTTGQLLLNNHFVLNKANEININVQGIKKGLYIAHVLTNNYSESQQFIIP